MFKPMALLKQERLPLALGSVSWLSLTGLLFEMTHLAWLLAISLSFFPSLFLLFTARFFFVKPRKIRLSPTEFKRIEAQGAGEPIAASNPHFDRFLTDFAHILEMQKQYWETKTTVSPEPVCVKEPNYVSFSTALKDYAQRERAFTLWQNYKKSVFDLLRTRGLTSTEDGQESSVEKLNYTLSERELYLFCPKETIRDAIEEVKFFLQALKKREKELEEINAYFDKVAADGIWLPTAKKEKIQEYQKSQELCQKQLEIDRGEILRNLEEIFTAL
ncbi:hypothetical protein FAI41_04270 [Acetobacteraceae bacterium]|nr:hypothetical protein FAI41_04270 [Acetobacteraceae bacterium]